MITFCEQLLRIKNFTLSVFKTGSKQWYNFKQTLLCVEIIRIASQASFWCGNFSACFLLFIVLAFKATLHSHLFCPRSIVLWANHGLRFAKPKWGLAILIKFSKNIAKANFGCEFNFRVEIWCPHSTFQLGYPLVQCEKESITVCQGIYLSFKRYP